MSKLVALSFDDGPSYDSTMNDMLNLLEKYQIKGSFFIIGNKVNKENRPVLERAIKMGCDIQNHSWTHPTMPDLTEQEIREEYEKTDTLIEELTGKKAEFFRPPYIAVNDLMYKVIKTPFICGQGCKDWEAKYDSTYRLHHILEDAKDGLIYLLHVMEGNEATLKAVDQAVPKLKAEGYEFVTVPELFKRKNINPNVPASLWTEVI